MSLITADALKAALADADAAARTVILDVRWTLPKPNGADDYAAGHIPGAQYADLDTQLSGTSDDPTLGRHPLPAPADLQETIRAWGITPDSTVVVYDDNSSLGAARGWWILRWAGLQDVRVLDGGLNAWKAAGGELSTETPQPAPSDITITTGAMPTVDADQAAATAALGTLIDARPSARFRGEDDSMDPRAGHIPGALNRPATENYRSGALLPKEELAAQFADLGADNGAVVAYCGSGVTACSNILALEQIGVRASLYSPSWSGWSADESRPVAKG